MNDLDGSSGTGGANDAPMIATSLTLRGVMCPINWVKAKIGLEKMEGGQVIELVLDQGEPARNVPRSAKLEGHSVIAAANMNDGGHRVLIRKRVD